jgi:hypothetical protein
MSSFTSYLSSLLPFFKKDTVLEDLRITKDELEAVIKSYQEAETVFKAGRFKNEKTTRLAKDYQLGITNKLGSRNFINDITKRLENVYDNVLTVELLLDKTLEKDIIKDGLTAKKASLIQAANYSSFISRFSYDVLNYVYVLETEQTEKLLKSKDVEGTSELPPAKINYIISNISSFGRLLDVLGLPNKEFVKVIDDLPDVVVNEKTIVSLDGVYGESNLTPFSSQLAKGFMEMGPIYHFRIAIAEWQARRYKANQDKKQLLELRKLNLEMENDKNPSPKVQAEIEYLATRIGNVEYSMKQMEEAVA